RQGLDTGIEQSQLLVVQADAVVCDGDLDSPAGIDKFAVELSAIQGRSVCRIQAHMIDDCWRAVVDDCVRDAKAPLAVGSIGASRSRTKQPLDNLRVETEHRRLALTPVPESATDAAARQPDPPVRCPEDRRV